MNYKNRFIELLLAAGALRFGSFQTKSGRLSPYFFNTGLLNTSAILADVASIYAAALRERFLEAGFDNLYGPAYKGIPLAVATALQLHNQFQQNVSFTFNRKETKDHGEGGQLVGWTYRGDEKVIIVEDVLTAGTSIRESLQLLQRHKIKPRGIILGIDRQERGSSTKLAAEELATEHGVPVHAIVTLDDIVTSLHNRTCLGRVWIDDAMLATIKAYRHAHG